jgi:putative hydrolase of the HAD superfamily
VVLRGVVFDLFGTLVAGWGEETAAQKSDEIADILGVPLSQFRELMRTTYALRANGSLGGPEEMLGKLCAMIGRRPPQLALARAAAHRVGQFHEVLREPRPEVSSLLAVLRDRTYRVGLISDCSGETPLVWDRPTWTAPIQASVFSWSEGVRKPDPRLYRRVGQMLDLEASDCLYIGDGGSRELTGAEEVGMRACQLRPFRVDGQVPLQYDPEPGWSGGTISTLSEVLPLLAG